MRHDDTMTLEEMQTRFGRALRAADGALPPADGAPDFAERFGAYRNNSWQFFLAALEQTYPVLRRRVGWDFFRALVLDYRAAHPSRRGDLHWAGSFFSSWLEQRMADTGYEWLADLARLEWAVAESSVATQRSSAALSALGAFAPGALAELRLEWQPSLRLVAARFPVWTVWQANQGDAESAPVDLEQGGEYCVVACIGDMPAVYRIDATDFALVDRLRRGDTLGDALAAAATDADSLGRVLAWAFAEQLVVDIVSPSAPV